MGIILHRKVRYFQSSILMIGVGLSMSFNVCAQESGENTTPSGDSISLPNYDVSRVQITPVQRQWVEIPIVKTFGSNTSKEQQTSVFGDYASDSITEQSVELSDLSALPIGLPIKMLSHTKFIALKVKPGAQIYWRLNAILYQDVIYLLE